MSQPYFEVADRLMEKRLIFIDIDGTLTTPAGTVPPSAKEAIQQARENGHTIFLCTGRSRPEIIDEIVDIGFDGIIGAGGGYIEIEKQIIHQQTMNEDDVLAIIDYFHAYDIAYYLESNHGIFGSEHCVAAIRNRVTEELEPNSPSYLDADAEFHWFYELLQQHKHQEIDFSKVNKISFLSDKHHPFTEIESRFQDQFEIYRTTVPQFGSESGELAIKGINKFTAIQFVYDYLGRDAAHTIAFGDGNNDIHMFAAVEYAIAMENASTALKKVAKEVTAKAEDDGIKQAFTKHGII